jgi:hypothetical protein
MQGRFYVDAAYDYENVNASELDPGRALTSSSRSNDDIFAASLSYGVTNDLSVSVGEAYDLESSRGGFSGAEELTRYDRGFENPNFDITYRILRPSQYPVSLDVTAGFSPDIVNARSSTITEDGTVARGGGVYDVHLAIGRQTPFVTIQGILDASYLGRETVNGADGETSTDSAYWQESVGLATQSRFSDRLSLNLEAEYDFSSDFNGLVEPEDVASVVHSGPFGQAYARLNYHIIPDQLVGSLEYVHGFYGASRVTFPADAEDDSEIRRSANTVGVRLWYAFR